MLNRMPTSSLLALALWLTCNVLVGCVGSGGNSRDGGSGIGGGGIGGTGGVFDGGGCIDCFNGCFDCSNTRCAVCGMGGFSGFAGDGGSGGFSGFGMENDAGDVVLPWNSPFLNSGDDGTWRQTGSDTLCMGAAGLSALGIWSDERGVYVMGSGAFTERAFLADKASRSTPPQRGNALPAPPPFDAGAAGFTGGAGGIGGFGGFGGASGIGGFGGSGTGGAGGSFSCFEGAFQCSGEVIYFNDGEHGWRQQIAIDGQSASETRLSGLPLAELVLHSGNNFLNDDCNLRMINGTTQRCEQSSAPVPAFFGVNAQLAYASVGTNLLVYDGQAWAAHPASIPFAPAALWANATDVVAVGEVGRIARLRDGVWTSDNRSIQQLTAVWGGSGEELWVGTDRGDVLHRDASGTWLETLHVGGVTCSASDPIVNIWGSGDTVYFHTDRALARWDGSRLSDLANWTCALTDPFSGQNSRFIRDIWGNGPNELFLAVADVNRFADGFTDTCGDGFVVYFDGIKFHRL